MGKRVYISADYDINSGDRDVIDELNKWKNNNHLVLDFTDTAQVASGSVANDSDCRICDLKAEFNRQINASSAVIFVIGDKTASRTAGSSCQRNVKSWYECMCTPYKQNTNGIKRCKVMNTCPVSGDDVGSINSYSYLRHEFEQAEKQRKKIIVVYNALYKYTDWLPTYMKRYEEEAQPFWIRSLSGDRNGNYDFIKRELGYE